MALFLDKLKNLFSRKDDAPEEDAWPDDQRQKSPPESDSFIYTREFSLKGKKSYRFFIGARKVVVDDRRTLWFVSEYKREGKKTAVNEIPWTIDRTPSTLEDALSFLSGLDKKFESEKNTPIDGAYANIRTVAQAHGLHFQEDGSLIKVSRDAVLQQETIMTKGMLETFFNKESKVELNTWQALYDRLLLQEYAHRWYLTKADLKAVDEVLHTLESEYKNAMNLQTPFRPLRPDYWDEDGSAWLTPYKTFLHHLVDGGELINYLRAGEKLCAVHMTRIPMDPKALERIDALGKACVEIAVRRFGLSREEAAKIPDIMMTGPDPFGSELPLQKALRELREERLAAKKPSSPSNKP